MNHVDEFHEFFEVGKKMHTKMTASATNLIHAITMC